MTLDCIRSVVWDVVGCSVVWRGSGVWWGSVGCSVVWCGSVVWWGRILVSTVLQCK